MSITRRALMGAAAATTAFGAPRARAQRPVVRVGVMNDMSGPYRDVNGPTGVACTRQAIQEFSPGGFDIELLSADHQNKPDVGAGIARQWYDGGVDLIVEVANSAVALAVSTLGGAELDRLASTCSLICGHPCDFLSRVGRRHLQD